MDGATIPPAGLLIDFGGAAEQECGSTRESRSLHLLQEVSEPRGRLELWNRIESFQGAGEGVGQAPHRPRGEFGVDPFELQPITLRHEAACTPHPPSAKCF